ncbi:MULTISPECIES: acyl-CoA carboxylase subunit epsilon [unclassified Streptomyces]|uniref:acyl-CoA carboxylase subunit epsilon n=1 Tax=unclassified Streptomyces TaxID=2593676 RepID=UPI001BEC683F|nr:MULTISPECIES: acyl-CoA carboxylase subunit epsilon [unclassified Streptomyces]MBT2406146.1 acyl-CoA carboxylase subunit epsilon [Streptomyces sp. ISL-21]MBT2459499.1 acyl-CoA carboxylase subunit epsilon [Streptomyces sp. ISL-86]MBT2609204.1 acyl-CoA carboxylase subunit epsilon [Streptomyces sp. ISL-87]
MSMLNDVPISSLLRIHRGCAEPEELAAISVVVACLAGRAAHTARRSAGGMHRRPGPVLRNHGCWAGCWACR